jgi:hypothetical protein
MENTFFKETFFSVGRIGCPNSDHPFKAACRMNCMNAFSQKILVLMGRILFLHAERVLGGYMRALPSALFLPSFYFSNSNATSEGHVFPPWETYS